MASKNTPAPTAFVRCEEVLQAAGFSEDGCGDDFTSYSRQAGGMNPAHQIYLYENGRWEHHNHSTEKDDEPSSAQARGKGAASLKKYLSKTF